MQRCFLLGSVLICLCCAVVLWGATFYPRSESSAEMCAYWYICWVGGWPTFASPQPWLGAAPPFAPFEKWPAAQSTPAGGPAFPLPAAGLTPTSNNDSDLHAQGVQHRIDGFKARMCARTQGFVQV